MRRFPASAQAFVRRRAGIFAEIAGLGAIVAGVSEAAGWWLGAIVAGVAVIVAVELRGEGGNDTVPPAAD